MQIQGFNIAPGELQSLRNTLLTASAKYPSLKISALLIPFH